MTTKKGYLLKKDDHILPLVYLSLKAICQEYSLNYFSAVRGKRIFAMKGEIIEVVIRGHDKRGKSFGR
jgi:hypothetical protein